MGSPTASIADLEAVYRRDLTRFVRAATAIVGDETTATDAVQEAFASAVRSRKTYRGEVPLEGWIWRIVVNSALQLRRERPAIESEPDEWLSAEPNGHPTEDIAVRRWIAALPERQRLAVFLRYFADLDYRGIAAALDVEVGTVSATLAAAHSTLRRSIQEVER
jgi:RNA polymerase sigma-70 factor (ECF subfamily)